jgi:hypothetical protein
MNDLEKAFAAIEAHNVKPVVWRDWWEEQTKGCLVVDDELGEVEDVVHRNQAGGI